MQQCAIHDLGASAVVDYVYGPDGFAYLINHYGRGGETRFGYCCCNTKAGQMAFVEDPEKFSTLLMGALKVTVFLGVYAFYFFGVRGLLAF